MPTLRELLEQIRTACLPARTLSPEDQLTQIDMLVGAAQRKLEDLVNRYATYKAAQREAFGTDHVRHRGRTGEQLESLLEAVAENVPAPPTTATLTTPAPHA